MDRNNLGADLLYQANAHWQNLSRFRSDRERAKRYNYGDQWSDVVDVDGRKITEEQYIKEQGSIPLKNNLIRRLVRNVVGVYSSRATDAVCSCSNVAQADAAQAMTAVLRHVAHINRLPVLYTRSMEEFLISGMVVHRKSFGMVGGVPTCRTDYVQPTNFFVDNHMCDFRGWDCSCLGEMHDVDFADVCRHFAHSEEDISNLRIHFSVGADSETLHEPLSDMERCRVVEVWRRENRREYVCHDPLTGTRYRIAGLQHYRRLWQENLARTAAAKPAVRTRMVMRQVWRYYFLAPDGHILSCGDTPYAHGGHPYVFRIYPMIDNEVHSFVADVIDQQRYTNRLITLYDWIMRASSKGVLLVPDDCVPRGCSPSDFADAWSRYNGVIFYRPSAQGNIPQQVANNSTNIGIKELLEVQLKFFEDISGVNEALQGRTSGVAMSAELFGRQTKNATITLLDILQTFNEFVIDCTKKDMDNARRFFSAAAIRQMAGCRTDVEMLRKAPLEVDCPLGL